MNVLTLWFPPSVKPARRGHYLTASDDSDVVIMRYWSGSKWMLLGMTQIYPPLKWAGLAFDPSRAVECSDAETGEPGMWVPTRPAPKAPQNMPLARFPQEPPFRNPSGPAED